MAARSEWAQGNRKPNGYPNGGFGRKNGPREEGHFPSARWMSGDHLDTSPTFPFPSKGPAFVEQRQKVERGVERFRVVSAMTSPIRKLVENIVQAIARDLPTHAFHTLGDVGLLGASRLCLWVFASRSPICPGLAR